VRTVNVVDSTLPTMTLLGVNPLYIEPYDVYTESNVILDDGSNLVSISNNINNTASGTYTVTYTANDGTNSNTYTRDVYVQDLDVYSNASVILQRPKYPYLPNTNIITDFGFENCVISKDGTMAVASVARVRSGNTIYTEFLILDWVSSPGSTPGNQHNSWVSNVVDQNTTTGYWEIRQNIIGNPGHDFMGNRMEISDDKMVVLVSDSTIADVLTLNTSTNLYGITSYGTSHGGAIALSGDGNTYALAYSTLSYATGQQVGYLLTFTTNDYWATRINKFAQFPIAGTTDFDRIGNNSIALSFDGNILAFNVEEWNGNNSPFQTNNGRGKVVFYKWDYDSSINAYDWLPLTQLTGSSPYEFFGSKIEMSGDGNCVAISSTRAYNTSTYAKYGSWSVYDNTSKPYVNVYDWDSSSNSYLKRGNTIYSSSSVNDDLFGVQLVLSDDKNSICIFTPFNDNNGLGSNGLLELYTYTGNDWVKLGIGASGYDAYNRLGINASATSDLTKIVCAYRSYSYNTIDYSLGYIFTFEYSNSTPIQLFGNATVNLNIYQPYTDAGYLTGLKYTVDTSNAISTLDNTTIGDYTQTYIATDGGSNVATAVRSITVRYP